MKLRQNGVNKIINPCAFIFFFLTDATWYFHAIYLVFTYLSPFTDYEEDFFKVISNLRVQGSKFGGKFDKFGGKFDKFGGKSF